MEFLGFEGLTIDHSPGSPVSGGTFTITTPPSNKVRLVSGEWVYSGPISFTFSGGTHSSGTPGSATGAGTINVTSTKNKVSGKFVIRENDTGSMTGTYVPPSTPPPTVPFTSDVEITDSGQDKVRGN
jgi:hypothetical protein